MGERKGRTMTILLLLLTKTYAQYNYISPHYRKDGTYVEGHYRSRPDHNLNNNINSPSNLNNGMNINGNYPYGNTYNPYGN